MTKEDKELLLKDLCGRLPYGIKVTWDGKHPLTVTPHIYCAIANEDNINNLPKLLLRPLSSMTESERKEFDNLSKFDEDVWMGNHKVGFPKNVRIMSKCVDWLNKNMFDFRGLIPKNLAIEVTKENNPYENI